MNSALPVHRLAVECLNKPDIYLVELLGLGHIDVPEEVGVLVYPLAFCPGALEALKVFDVPGKHSSLQADELTPGTFGHAAGVE